MTISVKETEHGTWDLHFTTTAARSAVFDYIRQFQRHVEWEEGLLEVQTCGGQAGADGAYVKLYGTQTRPKGFLKRMFWTPARIDCTITASERPDRLAWIQQHWRDQSSEGYERQDVEVRLSDAEGGCRVTFTRRLMPDDATSLGFVMGLYGRMRPSMSRMPLQVKAQLLELQRHRSPTASHVDAFELSSDEMAGELLERLPVGGPGSRSLARLKAVLDNGLPQVSPK